MSSFRAGLVLLPLLLTAGCTPPDPNVDGLCVRISPAVPLERPAAIYTVVKDACLAAQQVAESCFQAADEHWTCTFAMAPEAATHQLTLLFGDSGCDADTWAMDAAAGREETACAWPVQYWNEAPVDGHAGATTLDWVDENTLVATDNLELRWENGRRITSAWVVLEEPESGILSGGTIVDGFLDDLTSQCGLWGASGTCMFPTDIAWDLRIYLGPDVPVQEIAGWLPRPGAASILVDCPDADEDGHCQGGGDDCDDTDPSIYPGAAEIPYDGVAQDCSGTDLIDVDEDGFPSTQVGGGTDCDDADPAVYPGAIEVAYDGVDNDCLNGDLIDVDEDGFPFLEGDGPDQVPLDCDDTDASIYPGATEIPLDGIDQDCSGADLTDGDSDGDGFGTGLSGDCNDDDASIYPGADEVPYDGIDQDCSGADLTDVDFDGYASTAVAGGTDCDDAAPAIHPGEEERCNGLDDDCDAGQPGGGIDEGLEASFFADRDGDGFGTELEAVCAPTEGYVTARGDCDDQDPSAYPGADDPPDDAIDQDCGGTQGPEVHVGLSATSTATIQAAIEAAAEGTTIWVGPGTYLEAEISFLGKALTLISTQGAEETVIDAQSKGRVLLFNSGEGPGTFVRGFTLTGGLSNRGAGVRTYRSAPILEELIIVDNEATTDGGGFNFGGGSPVLRKSVVQGNRAPNNLGGGGFADSGAILELQEVTFQDNESAYGGGGFIGKYITLVVDGCVFGSNRTLQGSGGGGMYLLGTSGEITGTNFSWNQSTDEDPSGYARGGGLYLSQSPLTVTGCQFEANSAYQGGAAFTSDSSPVFTDCTWTRNESLYQGGALYLHGGQPAVTGGSFTRNVAGTDGGAILADGSVLVLSSTGLTGNVSGGNGGAIASDSAEIYVADCDLTENTAVDDGGAVFASGSQADLAGSTVADNEAGGAGGGVAMADCQSQLAGNLVSGNQATEGGGMWLSASSGAMTHCVVNENESTERGGGILFRGGDPMLICCILTHNVASEGGGVYADGSSPTFDHCAVTENSGGGEGSGVDAGGICIADAAGSGKSPTLVDSIFAYNSGYDLYVVTPATLPDVTYSALYSPTGQSHNLSKPDATLVSAEPSFLSYGEDGTPSSLHLALASPLIDAGDPGGTDLDGSRADIGPYGGPSGGMWDVDGDGYFDYFWPGTYGDVPKGFDVSDYDADDSDPQRQ